MQRFLVLLFLIPMIGCVEEDRTPPSPPTGLYSVTGDGEIILYWTPNSEQDLAGYFVYRSLKPYGLYELIGETSEPFFVDDQVVNGVTYFYAVSAFDESGNESELSYEIVYDTPRPEGYGASLWDANRYPDKSGWDFSLYTTVPYDYKEVDFYFVEENGVYYLVAGEGTDVIDMGWTESFDDVTYAPPDGWSQTGIVEAIEEHTYVFWTWDNHFAKVRIRDLGGSRMVFDWAYQTDAGNGELIKFGGEENASK